MWKRLSVLLVLCVAHCASATPPASLVALQQVQLRQRAGVYAHDFTVLGKSHQAYYDRLKAWAEDFDTIVTTAHLGSRGLRGSIQPAYGGGPVILIEEDMTPNSKLYTLVHELAHLLGPKVSTEAEREVIAEVTAAMVCQRLGLDVWPQTAAYLAWNIPKEDDQTRPVQLHGAQIDALVMKIVKAARSEKP